MEYSNDDIYIYFFFHSFFKNCILLSEDHFTITNSVDQDEMQHKAAFLMGLHCLQKYSFKGFPNTRD